jgi:long-chain acyl-CoA synthetase
MSENRVEWAIADYAALCFGAVTVPIYPTLSSNQIEGLLKDSQSRVLFISTAALYEKAKAVCFRVPGLRHVVIFEDAGCPATIPLSKLYAIGEEKRIDSPRQFRRDALAVCPDEVATIIYTSGTTGAPKGAMLSHRNISSNVEATRRVLPLSSSDTTLSFLPLSHIFQRHVDYACIHAGATIAYAESLAGIADNMAEVRPTFAAGVPRFFEKMYARVMSQARESSPVRRVVFEVAMRAAKEYARTSRKPKMYGLADGLVYQRIREKLGGRLRWFISGGAPLEREIAEFFFGIGIPIFEGYGLSETSPVLTLNGPGEFKIGTVGKPVGDVQVRIAADGEIIVRGSNVMRGYFRMPAETRAVLENGWFRTGDIGEFDADGYLRIVDRKKDLIITSSGKNIAPQPIENRLKLIPYVENVVVVGDGRTYLAALIVPNLEALAAYARAAGIAFDEPSCLLRLPEIREMALREIDRRTQDYSEFEKIRRIAFIEKEFTIDGEEITPTMKVRRLAVERKYQEDIDRLYAA